MPSNSSLYEVYKGVLTEAEDNTEALKLVTEFKYTDLNHNGKDDSAVPHKVNSGYQTHMKLGKVIKVKDNSYTNTVCYFKDGCFVSSTNAKIVPKLKQVPRKVYHFLVKSHRKVLEESIYFPG